MRQSRWLCFQWKPEKDVIDSEISYQEGYDRLDCSDDADGDYCESNNNICQSEKQETEAHKLKESSPYSKKDHKDKKLSRKLRRKEVSSTKMFPFMSYKMIIRIEILRTIIARESIISWEFAYLKIFVKNY